MLVARPMAEVLFLDRLDPAASPLRSRGLCELLFSSLLVARSCILRRLTADQSFLFSSNLQGRVPTLQSGYYRKRPWSRAFSHASDPGIVAPSRLTVPSGQLPGSLFVDNFRLADHREVIAWRLELKVGEPSCNLVFLLVLIEPLQELIDLATLHIVGH